MKSLFNKKYLIWGIFLILFIFILLLVNHYQAPVVLALAGVLLVIIIFTIQPASGLYAMVFFLPVINWNFNYGNLEIPLIDLLSLLVAIAFVLRQAYLLIFDRQNFKIKLPLIFAFSLFFASVFISSFFSDNFYFSLWYAVRWILFFYLVYIILPFNLIIDKKILKNVLIFFMLSSLIVALMSLVSLVGQDWQNDFVRFKPIGLAGAFPLGDNQNLLAESLIVGIFFALVLKHWFKTERQKKIINLLAIFFSLILIGTFSRAAWLSLAAGIIIYLFYRKELFKKVLLPGLLAILILSPLAYYMWELQSQYYIGVSSTENRLLLTQISWQSFLAKPWFGQGSGQFMNLVADNIRFRAKYGEPLDSHGLGQKILAENGLIGVLAFIIFVGNIFYVFYRGLKNKAEINLILPLVAGSLGIFLFELFNTSYYKGKLWLPVAVTLAAIYLVENNNFYAKKN